MSPESRYQRRKNSRLQSMSADFSSVSTDLSDPTQHTSSRRRISWGWIVVLIALLAAMLYLERRIADMHVNVLTELATVKTELHEDDLRIVETFKSIIIENNTVQESLINETMGKHETDVFSLEHRISVLEEEIARVSSEMAKQLTLENTKLNKSLSYFESGANGQDRDLATGSIGGGTLRPRLESDLKCQLTIPVRAQTGSESEKFCQEEAGGLAAASPEDDSGVDDNVNIGREKRGNGFIRFITAPFRWFGHIF